jgi:phospholipid/cholesterol/gamma-HCH transport system substrate-binding protein
MNGARLRIVWLGLFLSACAGAVLFLLHIVGTSVLPQGDKYRITSVVPSVVAMAAKADVRQAGVKVGRVTAVETRGEESVLTLELDADRAPVYKNATVFIRAKSIAEENYLEIDPGTPRAGAVPEGGELPVERALEATQNDDVLSIFDAPRRRDLQETLDGLGGGLESDGSSHLNDTFESLAGLVDDGSDLARILADERRSTAGLIDNFGRVTLALGEREQALRQLTVRARVAAEAVAARDEELRDTIDSLPTFLRQARSSANRLGAFSRNATPVFRDLRLATADLVPAVRDLRPAARAARGTLAELERFAGAGTPAFRRLGPFSNELERFVGPYEGFVRQANPFVAYLEPYYREMTNMFALHGAHTARRDEISHTARVLLPISRSNLPGNLTAEQEELLQRLTGPTLDSRGSNPFPEPGTVGRGTLPTRTGERYPRLEQDPP